MPRRFCSQCGTKTLPGARFCSECGAPLGETESRTAAGAWQLTVAGAGVLVVFLAAGLAVWALILSPGGPRPWPGRGSASTAPDIRAGEPPAAKVDLPAEVKSFIADLTAKAREKPGDVDNWLKLGQVNARAGQLDPHYQADAIAAFEHVLALEPKNADALHGLANVHYDRDDQQQAIPVYEQYLALRPDDASARTDLATMYLYAGQSERAIATYQEVLRRNPSFLQAHYNLGVTYHGQGNDSAALRELEIARGLATEDGVRRQIDEMIASLKGQTPAPGAPSATAADGPRSPFQAAVEEAFRASPIMGPRIVRFQWLAPASGRVVVQDFPMEGMPAAVREKFEARLGDEMRAARGAHPVDSAPRMEIADAASGKVMATIAPQTPPRP